MQHLEVSGAVRPLKWSLGVNWLSSYSTKKIQKAVSRCNWKSMVGVILATTLDYIVWFFAISPFSPQFWQVSIFTSAVARLVRFISAVVDSITISVQSDTAAVSARKLRYTTCWHCHCHQQCCHQHHRQALQMLLHGLLHLWNDMKQAQVIQSKCNVKATRKDRDRLRKEENFMSEFPCIVSLRYIRNQQDATLAVSFISQCKITLHVSDAFCVHHQ